MGEKFFIDSIKEIINNENNNIPAHQAIEAKTFIAQESAHSFIHKKFNKHLDEQGYTNKWEKIAARRVCHLEENYNHIDRLAVTAAAEHITAIFGDWLLANSSIFQNTEQRLKNLWLWHAAEELEHRATAFNILKSVSDDESLRKKWAKLVFIYFLLDFFRQLIINIRANGSILRFKIWRTGLSLLFGKKGLISSNYKKILKYFDSNYSPEDLSPTLSENWLRENGSAYSSLTIKTHQKGNTP